MAYDLKWVDENRRMMRVSVFDPITETDARSLIDQLRSLADSPDPFYLLLDIQEYDVRKAMSLSGMLQSEPMPRQTPALEKSRVAVLGGGPMVKMGLQLMQGMAPIDLIRAFDGEAEALRWLDEEARLSGV
jgi:hypothetical protein